MKFPKRLKKFQVFGTRVSLFKNTSTRLFGVESFPTKNRVVWAGPVFLLIQGR